MRRTLAQWLEDLHVVTAQGSRWTPHWEACPEPDCAVREAAAAGQIALARYTAYRRIMDTWKPS